MIVELTVENLAIIELSKIELGPGFTVLTGETGAGKSLLIDAIELALGERADPELVRTGSTKASVNVVLDLSQEPEVLAKCEELGVSIEDRTLYIQREVLAEGRSQCRIGGKLIPANVLRQLGATLIDLHGQHDHQSLLEQERHLAFLDDWIGAEGDPFREQVVVQFNRCSEIKRKLDALRMGVRDREHRLDLLRFQVNEIEAVEVRIGESAELEAQLSRLKNAGKLYDTTYGAHELINGYENCAVDLLGAAVKNLEDVVRFDPQVEELVAPIRQALYEVEEAARGLSVYFEGLDTDPSKLDEIANRIEDLKRLKRKYGEDEAKILAFLADAREQLNQLEDNESSESELAEAFEAATEKLAEAARALTKLRRERAQEFGRLVQEQLRDLAMDRAVFVVDIKDQPIDQQGADRIEFFFSANAGEPPRPLGKIASGGEISRVMLAIKTALAGRAGVPTLIFDEVDAGLGGRVAATVARKLAELSRHYQVLVISHLPQIASQADTHFRIEKLNDGDRVETRVRLLNANERVSEIARMLAGDHITESALANAREMLGLSGSLH
jgi:DNA repair protein RecN (Recombination protein N)